MKDTVIKINILRKCVHITKLKLHGDRVGVDGLASIRRSLRLKKGHIVTPLTFYINYHSQSFNGLKLVMFVDDKPMDCGVMSFRIHGMSMHFLRLYGNAIICLKDKNTGRLVGVNSEQVTDIMSSIEVMEGCVDTKKK